MILKNYKISTLAIMAGSFVLTAAAAHAAGPSIGSPYVTKGKTDAEVKTEYSIDEDEGTDDAWAAELGVSHSFTDYYNAKLVFEVEDAGRGEDVDYKALAIENKFQLAPRGEFFVDPGLKLTYERNLQDGPDAITAELILAKKIGQFSNGMEMSVSRDVGEDSSNDLTYAMGYGLKYNYSEDFQFGAEWYSNFGDFDEDFDDQTHRLGPVIYGNLGGGFEYETGALFGVSDSAEDVLLKVIVGYTF